MNKITRKGRGGEFRSIVTKAEKIQKLNFKICLDFIYND